MNTMHVFRREVRALLLSPQTYAIGAAYLILSGVFFVNLLVSSEIADLEQYYSNIASTMLVLVPVVAMRSFAEERRSGSLELTLSWRISRTSLVLGKFAANTVYLWSLSSIVWLYYRLVGDVAHVQMGRTAGGFVGLLLMGMAFSALALMVSARAASPAGAAFGGFGLLLFLWILDYAPGWIGDWLAGLGPTRHFTAFPKGVVYWEDVAYFVMVTLVGLGFAVVTLERDHPGRTLASLLRHGAAVAAVVVFGSGTALAAGDVKGQVDLTPTKQNTITETTRDVIRAVAAKGESIRVTGFSAPLSQHAEELRALVKLYRGAGAEISLRLVDPDAQPGEAAQAGIAGYGEAVVRLGDRRQVLTNANQGSLTNALLRLARPSKPRVCFTAGHGERDVADRGEHGASTLAGTLRYLAYDVKPVALFAAGAPAELSRCAVVVVAGPRFPFTPGELGFLAAHAEHDGRLVVMADASSGPVREQLNQLLAPWGVSFGAGLVRDDSALADDASSIVSLDYGSATSPPVTRLAREGVPVVLSNALPVEPSRQATEQGAFSELVRSSSKSRNDDGEGPFVLAGVADWSRMVGSAEQPSVARTRIGLVGTAELMANRAVDTLGNRVFVNELVQWIAHEDDVIAASRASAGFTKIALTDGQKNRLVRQGIVLPVLALVLPLPAAALRLRRG